MGFQPVWLLTCLPVTACAGKKVLPSGWEKGLEEAATPQLREEEPAGGVVPARATLGLTADHSQPGEAGRGRERSSLGSVCARVCMCVGV